MVDPLCNPCGPRAFHWGPNKKSMMFLWEERTVFTLPASYPAVQTSFSKLRYQFSDKLQVGFVDFKLANNTGPINHHNNKKKSNFCLNKTKQKLSSLISLLRHLSLPLFFFPVLSLFFLQSLFCLTRGPWPMQGQPRQTRMISSQNA